MNCSLQKVME